MKLTIRSTAEHPVRLAFVDTPLGSIWRPTTGDDGTPRWSCQAILGKDHPAVAEINAAEEAVAKAKWPNDWQQKLAAAGAKSRRVLKDGVSRAQYPGYAGNYFLAMSSKAAPQVRRGDAKTPAVQGDGLFYPGVRAHLIIEIWAQDNQFGKFPNTELKGLVFAGHDTPFAGGAPLQDSDFADLGMVATPVDLSDF